MGGPGLAQTRVESQPEKNHPRAHGARNQRGEARPGQAKGEDVKSDGANKPGMYFVFSEPITGPRFNFDASHSDDLQFWTDIDWGMVGPVRGFAVAGKAIAPPPQPQGASWNRDSADVARVAFARPFRVGYHADELLPNVGGV